MSYKEQGEIISQYEEHLERYQANLIDYKKASNKFSYFRLAIVIVAIPILYFASTLSWIALLAFLVILAIVFIWAVVKQSNYDKDVSKCEILIALNENELNVIQKFQNQYYNGEIFEDAHHSYTDDLDIFGLNSLYALTNRCKTYNGIHKLAEFFTKLPEKDQLDKQKLAIQELEPRHSWRQGFASSFYNIEEGQSHDLATAIDQDLQVDLSFATAKSLLLYRKIIPFLWLAIVGLYFIDIALANTFATFLFILNLLLAMRKANNVSAVQGRLSQASQILISYAESLSYLFNEEWKSDLIKNQINEFQGDQGSGITAEMLSKLSKIIDHLDYRLNLIPAIVLNGLVLWDFYVIQRLSKWRSENDGELIHLFEFIGEMEALSSLATWSYNHPHFSYAEIKDEYFSFEGLELRHPLIPATVNVANDFSIKQGMHLNIITGSNMSGKSTLLRTVGINTILAYTGAKVGAQSFSVPIVKLISYMRIKDILEESVSTFKAELNRIEMILKILGQGKKCFILIDEMLRGTNSKDKLAGSIGIAKRLLEEKTYAMIATHDIKLAELGNEIQSGIANYYFDIDYSDGDLVFDYKVKDGICENFNASFLLNQLGIQLDEEV